MDLHRTGREYVTWPIDGAPVDATFDITFDDGETWLPMETVDDGARMLLAGPDAEPGTATVLAEGRTYASVRLIDNPEIVVRAAGSIHVT